MVRKLTNPEVKEINSKIDKAYQERGSGIRGLQATSALTGGGFDITRLIASRYNKEAFTYGWKKHVAEHQGEKLNAVNPRTKVRRWSIGLGAVGGLALGAFVGLTSAYSAPVIAGAIALSGAAGAALGLFDSFFENLTTRGMIKSGAGAADATIENYVKEKDQANAISSLREQVTNLQKKRSSFTDKVRNNRKSQALLQ